MPLFLRTVRRDSTGALLKKKKGRKWSTTANTSSHGSSSSSSDWSVESSSSSASESIKDKLEEVLQILAGDTEGEISSGEVTSTTSESSK